jgi:hypothetical protein
VRKRGKKMVEMVDDQTVNEAANPLKKGKKIKIKRITSSGAVELHLVVLMLVF